MKAVTFTGAGDNEVVLLAEREDPEPAAHEIRVAARYAGVNWADLAQRMGSYPAPPGSPQDIPGLEVAGVVTAVGTGVQAWQPGDRVFGIVGGGGLADRVCVHERHVAAQKLEQKQTQEHGKPQTSDKPPKNDKPPKGDRPPKG